MPRELADRLRIVLLAAEGWLNVEIAAQLGVAVATVAKWRDRFALAGIDGLMDRPRPGRPRLVDRPAIVAATLRPPRPDVTRWSARDLARQLGLGEATVARAWREYGLTPRPGGAFTFTVQPELTAAAVDVVGLCLTPRARIVALVCSADQPLQTPASSHAAPARPGWASPRSNGQHLLDVTSHEISTRSEPREFLRHVVRSYPARRVHVVVDSAARSAVIASRPPDADSDVRAHFTLTTQMWLNLLDVWLWMLTRDAEVDGAHTAGRIRALIDSGLPSSWVKQPAESVVAGARQCDDVEAETG